jgi:superfamily I DNA and/or RNA helicase
MNVAFTRARKKLIIFGSVSTLDGSPVFTEFLSLIREQQWVTRQMIMYCNNVRYLINILLDIFFA